MLTKPHRLTRFALYWMEMLGEPLVAMIAMLAVILRKGLGASVFEISVFAATRPVISLFSFYWSANLAHRPQKLKSNLMFAYAFSRLPFLLLPLFPTVWYVIFAQACYQLFYRARTPALMEILKQNIEKEPREKLFTWVYVASFLECVLLSLFLGKVLDAKAGAWPWMFAGFSLISLTSLIGMYRIPMKIPQSFKPVVPSFEQNFLQPWKESYALTKKHPHFAHFQWSFMIGGFGLMLLFPAFAIYVSDVLQVSYNSLSLARCLWMAVGVTLSSPIWRIAIKHLPTHKLTSIVCIGFSFYPIALLIARVEIAWFYLAFLLYGIAQAGSHLLWHLSGTLFAGDEENSAKFTTVNILTVGLRGLIAPALGGLICKAFGPTTNMVLGSALCLIGGWYMLASEKKLLQQP